MNRMCLGLATLIACSGDPGIDKLDPETEGSPATPTTAETTTPTDTSGTGGPDPCDGVDNNGNGLVDEGWPDFDGDAIADCVDDACGADPPALLPVAPELCPGPWDVVAEAQVTYQSMNISGVSAVGQLTDDNNDGVVDANDIPDIAVVNQDFVAVYSSDGAVEHLFIEPEEEFALNGLLVADVNADGTNEIVFVHQPDHNVFEFTVRAMDGLGTLVWESGILSNSNLWYLSGFLLSAADLDGDGVPEVVVDHWILDGATGALQATLATPFVVGTMGHNPRGTHMVADLDLDGSPEILIAGGVYAPDGSRLWDTGLYYPGLAAWEVSHPAIVQLDADPEPEVLFAGNSAVHLFEHDGGAIATWPYLGADDTPPCIDDFDGDGDAEVAIVSDTHLTMFELDGTKTWVVPTPYGIGCSAFDFDDNGASELVVGTYVSVDIVDGATGQTLWSEPRDGNGVYFTPVIADVDADGSAELVVPFGQVGAPNEGFRVYGAALNNWADAGSSWSMIDFAEGRLSDIGTVALPSLADAGRHRSRAPLSTPPIGDLLAPQLRVVLAEHCAASCTIGPQRLNLQVNNTGTAAAPAGAILQVLHGETVLHTETLPAIDPLAAVQVQVDLDPASLPGAIGFRIDAGFEQCQDAKVSFELIDNTCPG